MRGMLGAAFRDAGVALLMELLVAIHAENYFACLDDYCLECRGVEPTRISLLIVEERRILARVVQYNWHGVRSTFRSLCETSGARGILDRCPPSPHASLALARETW